MVGDAKTAETYGERFEFDLYLMQNASPESRRDHFELWLTDMEVTCGRCETDFSPTPAEVDEDDEILCSRCRGKKPGQR